MDSLLNETSDMRLSQQKAGDVGGQLPDEWQVIRHHSRSFSLASRLLPRQVRRDVRQLYAWCRWCDNVVDEVSDPTVASSRLQMLREDVQRIGRRRAVRWQPSRWIEELIQRYGIPTEFPLDLLQGMESDIDFRPLRDEADLKLYCYQVAGVVGIMMCHVMGVSDSRAFYHANSLGMAMQMTNIARDVAEDWERGRCYLPQSWISTTPVRDPIPDPAVLKEPIKRLLELAEIHYERGRQGYRYLPGNCRLAIRLAAAIYQDIGRVIQRHDFHVTDRRHFVGPTRKMVLGAVESMKELRDRFRGHERRAETRLFDSV